LQGPLTYGGIATLTPMSTPQEPCSRCGEETAVGSTYYSDRRSTVGRDGTHAFLCQECLIEGHLNRRGKPRTDEDLELIAATGLLIGAAVLTGNA
jgi:hypothetical protein